MDRLETRTRAMINQPTNPKLPSKFYVRYLGMPENISNLLGRQTVALIPPPLEVEMPQHQRRHNSISDTGRLVKTPMNVTIRCDDAGLVEAILINQFLIQRKQTDSTKNDNRYNLTFDIKVDYMDQKDDISYYVIYGRCRISTLTLPPSTQTVDDAPLDCELTVFNETTTYYSDVGDILVQL